MKILQQAIQALLHAVDVHVVSKARLAVDALDARLVAVDFPGMEVKDRGFTLAGMHLLQHPARHGIRQQPEVPATARRAGCDRTGARW